MTHHLHLLGQPRLVTATGALVLERKTAAVLTYLALEGATHKYRLAGWLWPASGETAARNNMRQLLRRLRVAAGEVVSGEDTIELVADIDVDVQQLSSLQNPSLELLRRDDELLAGLEYDAAPDFEEWLFGVREELRSQRSRAAQVEADRLEKHGQLPQALEFAQFRVRLEPLSEEAYRQAARLQYLMGNRSAALGTLERCRVVLRQELGVEPLPETFELLGLIERGTGLRAASPHPREAVLSTAILRPPVLAGREREWALMEDAWERGQIIYLEGEPGAGKTRLALDFAQSKGPVFHFQARPGDAGIPMASLARGMRQMIEQEPSILEHVPRWAHRELARLLPELGQDETLAPLSSEVEKLRFFDAIGELTMAHASFITVADDVQFSDLASNQANGYLMSKFSDHPGAVRPRMIVVYRRGELPAESEAGLSALVEAGIAIKISLQPLETNAIGSLLKGLGLDDPSDLAQGLSRYTGGNPLFILETVKHLIETGRLAQGLPSRLTPPGKVAALIGRRLQRLSGAALNLARAAAVARTAFDLRLAAAVLERPALELAEAHAELEATQVLHGNAFTHDLLYEATLAGIPGAIRQLLHANTARDLEGRDANPALIAQHWYEAGEADRAAQWWIGAAEQANGLGLYDEGNELLARAIETASSEALRFKAKVILADVLGPMGRVDEAIRLAQSVLAETDDARLRQRALGVLQNMYQGTGRFAEAETAIAEALELAEQLGEADRADAMRFAKARILRHTGRYAEALELLERVLPRYERGPAPSDLIQMLTLIGNTHNLLGQHAQAEPLLRRAYTMSRDSVGPALVILALSNLVYGLVCQGEPRRYFAEAEAALELGDYAIADNLRHNLALAYLGSGRDEEAMRHYATLAENTFDPNYRCVAWARLATLGPNPVEAVNRAREWLAKARTPSARFTCFRAAILHGAPEQRSWGLAQLEALDPTLLPWLLQLEHEALLERLRTGERFDAA